MFCIKLQTMGPAVEIGCEKIYSTDCSRGPVVYMRKYYQVTGYWFIIEPVAKKGLTCHARSYQWTECIPFRQIYITAL